MQAPFQFQQAPPRLRLILPAMVTICAVASAAFAQRDSDGRREAIFQAMKKRVEILQGERRIDTNTEPLKFSRVPILRFSDPTTERIVGDGTLWRLGNSGRPSAILAVEFLSRKSLFSFELTSLSDDRVRVSGTTGWKWAPTPKFAMTNFTDSPEPDSLPERRIRQMKNLVRGFRASEKIDGSASELRLLSQPVCRYDDLERGIRDGAVFVFALGTNPEILALIEAAKEPSEWRYGFARLSSLELRVELDGSVIWKRPNVRPFGADAEYYGTSESVAIEP